MFDPLQRWRELGLPDDGSYRQYADLGRPFVVWNLFVTPEFSTKPVESCFPVTGCGWWTAARSMRCR